MSQPPSSAPRRSGPGPDGPAGLRQRVAVYGIVGEGPPDKERVLLVRAASYLTVAGRWFLPGGGIDHGEDPVAALRRECREETGLDVEVGPGAGSHGGRGFEARDGGGKAERPADLLVNVRTARRGRRFLPGEQLRDVRFRNLGRDGEVLLLQPQFL